MSVSVKVDLGPVIGDVHRERLEGLDILLRVQVQFTLLTGLSDAAGCLLQLAQGLCQCPCQLYLLLHQPVVQISA